MSLKSLSPSYYARVIEASKRVSPEGKILDAGCSDGFFSFLNRAKGEVFGVDVNPGDVEIAKIRNPPGNYQVATLSKLPFPENFFDTIVTIDVLEHIADDEPPIKEFFRTLKKGGRVIIIVPQERFPFTYDPINYILKFFGTKIKSGMWAYGHQRLYTHEYLQELLKRNGFEVIEKSFVSHHLLGIIDNCYLNLLVQPFVKSDPSNQSKIVTDTEKLSKRINKELPVILKEIRNLLIRLDKHLFGNSKSSLEILIVADKI